MVIKLLLEKEGININSKDKGSQMPLLQAVEKGYKVIIKLLLKKEGININFKDKDS